MVHLATSVVVVQTCMGKELEGREEDLSCTVHSRALTHTRPGGVTKTQCSCRGG